MFLVWGITDDLPNSPNFPPAKPSRYMVVIPYKYVYEVFINTLGEIELNNNLNP